MAQLQNYGGTLWKTPAILTLGLFLSGCSVGMKPETEVKVVTKLEKTSIPTVARPKPIQLNDTRVWVVTEDNLEEFIEEFKKTYGEVAYVALSMRDYENLALNIADLQRYIGQQKEVIVYYEKAVTPEPEKK
jgi:hypothetical protein